MSKKTSSIKYSRTFTHRMPGKVFSPSELADLARTELNEDPSMVKKDLKAIKEWIKKQPHLAKTAQQGKVYQEFHLSRSFYGTGNLDV